MVHVPHLAGRDTVIRPRFSALSGLTGMLPLLVTKSRRHTTENHIYSPGTRQCTFAYPIHSRGTGCDIHAKTQTLIFHIHILVQEEVVQVPCTYIFIVNSAAVGTSSWGHSTVVDACEGVARTAFPVDVEFSVVVELDCFSCEEAELIKVPFGETYDLLQRTRGWKVGEEVVWHKLQRHALGVWYECFFKAPKVVAIVKFPTTVAFDKCSGDDSSCPPPSHFRWQLCKMSIPKQRRYVVRFFASYIYTTEKDGLLLRNKCKLYKSLSRSHSERRMSADCVCLSLRAGQARLPRENLS